MTIKDIKREIERRMSQIQSDISKETDHTTRTNTNMNAQVFALNSLYIWIQEHKLENTEPSFKRGGKRSRKGSY